MMMRRTEPWGCGVPHGMLRNNVDDDDDVDDDDEAD